MRKVALFLFWLDVVYFLVVIITTFSSKDGLASANPSAFTLGIWVLLIAGVMNYFVQTKREAKIIQDVIFKEKNAMRTVAIVIFWVAILILAMATLTALTNEGKTSKDYIEPERTYQVVVCGIVFLLAAAVANYIAGRKKNKLPVQTAK